MAELDKAGGNMSANDIMSLMNDDNLVERYTNHLTKILFQYADPFIKAKYNAYLELTQPKQETDFFTRMKNDKEARDKKKESLLALTLQDGEPNSATGIKSNSRRSLIDLESPTRYESPQKQYIGI